MSNHKLGLLLAVAAMAGLSSQAALATQLDYLSHKERERDIFIEGREAKVFGHLSLPAAKGQCPAVLLLSGSGPTDLKYNRDFGHQWLDGIAKALVSRGFVVLQIDKRGYGNSVPRPGVKSPTDSIGEQAFDAVDCISYLKGQPFVDKSKIGILGHSQGGCAALLAARGSTAVRFIVLVASPIMPIRDFLPISFGERASSMGAPKETAAFYKDLATTGVEVARKHKTDPDVKSLVTRALEERFAATGRDRQEGSGLIGSLSSELSRPATLEFLAFEPVSQIRALDLPILAVFGGRDSICPAKANIRALIIGVLPRQKSRVDCLYLPDLDHRLARFGVGPHEEEPADVQIDSAGLSKIINAIELIVNYLKPTPR